MVMLGFQLEKKLQAWSPQDESFYMLWLSGGAKTLSLCARATAFPNPTGQHPRRHRDSASPSAFDPLQTVVSTTQSQW
jgi:hypothetical protein